MLNTKTNETLALLKGSLSRPVEKAFVQPASTTTGLQQYNLEAPAKRFVPVLTPLRNIIRRVTTGYGTAVNWKAITKINSTRVQPGVEPGKRGGVIATSIKEFTAAYKGMGLEDSVQFEAQYAGKNFMDIKATSVMGLLDSYFLFEEEILLGGNCSTALGTPTAPTGVSTAAGTTTTTRTAVARVVALTHQGYFNNGGASASLTTGITQSVARTNADGTTTTIKLGSSNQSAASAGVSVTAGDKIVWTWPYVKGAFGYALYTGLAGSEKLAYIGTVNTFTQTANEGAGNQAVSAITGDNSQDATVYDGILAQVSDPTNGGYIASLDGAKLTANGHCGVVEIDLALRWFWDNQRLSPDVVYCHAQEFDAINTAILTGGTNSIVRVQMAGDQHNMMGGTQTTTYLNKYAPGGAKELKIEVHPNMPPGAILFVSHTLPYKLNGVPSVFELELRQDYYAIEWPLKARQWEYGVYSDGVLKCYATFACGVIVCIGT